MCVNITNVLHENGHEVILCATRAGGPLEKSIASGVKYHILHKKHSADIAAFRRLVRIIRENDIALIHAHSSSVFWAVAAKLIVKNIKVIWHDHLGLRIYERNANVFYKLFSRWIDGIIAVNKDLAEWSHMNMKVLSDRVVIINNFPLLTILIKQTVPEVFTIVCLANLRPQKNHETIVRAVALLVKLDLPRRLNVIFSGSDDGSNYSRRIKQLINDLGLENIIDMPGSVEDTAALIAGADCGVLSSVSEGLPVALLEYGMAALPVVVTDVGQCADVVDQGKCGKLVMPDDHTAFANELLWIMENPDLASEMGLALKERVLREFGPHQFIFKYEDLLQEIYTA